MPYISDEKAEFKARFASYLVHEQVSKTLASFDAQKLDKILEAKPSTDETLKVCIVGAGMSGLYAALLLKEAKIPFDILEASTRPGGRVLTHYFSDQPHDYYDIGAMRFPKTPIMDRTFDLFQRRGVDRKLIEYIMESEKQPTRYNDITVVGDPKRISDDPFHVSVSKGGPVPDDHVDIKRFLDEAFGTLRKDIRDAVESKDEKRMHEAWEKLMKHDTRSLRDYLLYSLKPGLDAETVHWMETTQSATGWYGQAYTENVLESLAFEWFDKEHPAPIKPAPENGLKDKAGNPLVEGKWYCVEGGTTQLTNSLAKEFNKNISYGKRVTKMALTGRSDLPVDIHVHGEQGPRQYSAVINTTTLGALGKMDLTKMNLLYRTKAAIRSIHYDTSTKVGMKFTEPWWINHSQIRGGLGKTDMPLRVCVYPSYNLDDKDEAVLLCSYAWGQDAERVAAYINDSPAEQQTELKELMIYNLARLHSTDDESFEFMYKKISDSYITHHAYDWSKDINAAGAFALFSPGDFSEHYPWLVQPNADSRLFIVGEAASAHHAWIVGSLDSAMRGVTQLLTRFGSEKEKEALIKEFGAAHELSKKALEDQIRIGRLTQLTAEERERIKMNGSAMVVVQ